MTVALCLATLLTGGACAGRDEGSDEAGRPGRDAARAPQASTPSTDSGGVDAPAVTTRVLFDSNRTGNYEVFAMAPDGGDVVQLTDDPTYDSFWARPSPDGARLLFYRVPAGDHNEPGEYRRTALWIAAADGGDAREVIPPGANGWAQHGHAEWAPDATRLVMFAGGASNPQIWVTRDDGSEPVAVTDDPGTNIDPSWSPDGRDVVYVGCPERVCFPADQEIFTVPASGGERSRLTNDDLRDNDPYFAPDGDQIAFLTQTAPPSGSRVGGAWNIRRVAASGDALPPLTDDEHINSKPSWSADGAHVYFHRLVYGEDDAFQLWRLDVADGSSVRLTEDRGVVNEYPGAER